MYDTSKTLDDLESIGFNFAARPTAGDNKFFTWTRLLIQVTGGIETNYPGGAVTINVKIKDESYVTTYILSRDTAGKLLQV